MAKIVVGVEFDTDTRQTNVAGPIHAPLLCIDILSLGIQRMTAHIADAEKKKEQSGIIVPEKGIVVPKLVKGN